MTSYAIGIDLGTTYSCVGVVKDKQVKIIHNDCGSTTTASCVAFTDIERIIGDPAKTQGIKNFQNTVFDVKRLIGRKFSEAHIQNDLRHWPFTVVDQNGMCGVQVQFRKQTKTFSPEELSAMVLTKMKKSAEDFLRQKVTDAVITVPAYFNNSQRQATKDAAAIAGLNVLRIINEPTAAGIAYALDERVTSEQNILIYDLGGGTFDVTVMNNPFQPFKRRTGGPSVDAIFPFDKRTYNLIQHNCFFSVRSTSGDTHLGGEDFDSCLVDYCLSDIKKRYNTDISSNKRALRKLRTACETAKRLLSGESQTTIEVDGLINGVDYSLDIGRSRFEELCLHLFKKTLVFVEKALDDAKMAKEKIDEIILAGGSTRIPGVQRLLREYFQGKELNNTVHPDEAVAYGAAIQAAILAGNQMAFVQNVIIQDVTPMTLGLNTQSGNFHRIIAKNTCLPARESAVQVTAIDNQESGLFSVFEGENDRALENDLLGRFELFGIQKAPKHKVFFDVVFSVDENGILDVHATERGTKNTGKIRIIKNTGRLSKEEIARMTKNEAKFVADDMALKRGAQSN